MPPPNAYEAANVERFSGYEESYDAYRPRPPDVIGDLLIQLLGGQPGVVVDLASGTGLSTEMWRARARRVVGIEPNDAMRRVASARVAPVNGDTTVRFEDGWSSATNLPAGCADIVTCSQALHWMEPGSTLAEVARILRPGGIFAAYDFDWPPLVRWELIAAYDALMERVTALEEARGVYRTVRKWDKASHLDRMRASGRFRFVREFVLHHTEWGTATRFVGLARTQGSVATLLKAGLTEEKIGLTTLRRATEPVENEPFVWYFGYRLRVGVR